MIGSCARHLIEKILIRELLDERARNAAFGELDRQADAHRTRADDQHAIARPIHVRPQIPACFVQISAASFSCTGITFLIAPTQPLWVISKTIPSGSRYLHS